MKLPAEHARAAALLAEAEILNCENEPQAAARLFEVAAELELVAVHKVDARAVRTRAVLAMSAAYAFFKAGRLAHARELVRQLLATPLPPRLHEEVRKIERFVEKVHRRASAPPKPRQRGET
jgi:hypothetical protein